MVTAGLLATYWSFNYDFLLVFALSGKVLLSFCIVNVLSGQTIEK